MLQLVQCHIFLIHNCRVLVSRHVNRAEKTYTGLEGLFSEDVILEDMLKSKIAKEICPHSWNGQAISDDRNSIMQSQWLPLL